MKKQLFAISALMVTLGLTACGKPAETPKAADAGDALHAARAAEVTSLWRLAAA